MGTVIIMLFWPQANQLLYCFPLAVLTLLSDVCCYTHKLDHKMMTTKLTNKTLNILNLLIISLLGAHINTHTCTNVYTHTHKHTLTYTKKQVVLKKASCHNY